MRRTGRPLTCTARAPSRSLSQTPRRSTHNCAIACARRRPRARARRRRRGRCRARPGRAPGRAGSSWGSAIARYPPRGNLACDAMRSLHHLDARTRPHNAGTGGRPMSQHRYPPPPFPAARPRRARPSRKSPTSSTTASACEPLGRRHAASSPRTGVDGHIALAPEATARHREAGLPAVGDEGPDRAGNPPRAGRTLRLTSASHAARRGTESRRRRRTGGAATRALARAAMSARNASHVAEFAERRDAALEESLQLRQARPHARARATVCSSIADARQAQRAPQPVADLVRSGRSAAPRSRGRPTRR